jgi:glycosyltransferase involved in cell wall biosynthesis
MDTPRIASNLLLTVTVPIYNEEANIVPLYEKIRDAMHALGKPWELVLVNDGSSDQSPALLDELAARDPRITVVHFPRNYGQTAAMMAGMDHARGEIIVPMDGDLQNDPADIGRLLDKLGEGFDVVSGWRKDRQDHAIKRTLPSRLANSLISRVSGVHLHDYGCSLKAYRREVLEGVKLYGEMHRFVPIYAAWNGARVAEIPVTHHARLHGESKYGLERVIKVVLDLLVVKFLFRYSSKPIYVFGGFGLLSGFMGFLAGVWAVVLKGFWGTSFSRTPLPLLCVFLGAIGVLSILMGLLAEMMNRTYHESQAKSVYKVARLVRLDGTKTKSPRVE